MFEYDLALTVDFDLGRDVPAFFRAFMLAYRPFFFGIILSPIVHVAFS